MLSIPGAEHDAATSGDDLPIPGCDFGQHRRLAVAETGFALELEDQADAGPRTCRDGLVEVNEVQAQLARERPPDRGLAGTHRADQEDIARRVRREIGDVGNHV